MMIHTCLFVYWCTALSKRVSCLLLFKHDPQVWDFIDDNCFDCYAHSQAPARTNKVSSPRHSLSSCHLKGGNWGMGWGGRGEGDGGIRDGSNS